MNKLRNKRRTEEGNGRFQVCVVMIMKEGKGGEKEEEEGQRSALISQP